MVLDWTSKLANFIRNQSEDFSFDMAKWFIGPWSLCDLWFYVDSKEDRSS
jgi:hypothetical protein